MIHPAKIHREIVNGIAGFTCPFQRLKNNRLAAVKVSTPYTATEMIRDM